MGGNPIPRLATLRFYNLRHQFVTELSENGVPDNVIRELAGHIDPEMTRHYSHPRIAACRAAVETLTTVKPAAQKVQIEASYVTSHVTKQLAALAEAS